MRFRILGLMAAGLLAACSSGTHTGQAQSSAPADAAARTASMGAQPTVNASAAAVRVALGRNVDAGFAALPDRGDLVVVDSARKVHKAGAYTFHPVSLSEEHALNAIGPGHELVITAPNGQPIHLAYERHVEHEDGNWTWIGRDADGRDAVITFGEKAVFGSIPNGNGAPLRLNIAAGKPWLIETDNRMIAASNSVGAKPRAPDSLLLRTTSGESVTLGRDAAASAPASLIASEADTANPVVDVLVGYTSGFASRLGGASQAMTRLNFLVDITNQAYATSQVPGRIRLVKALQVAYTDATSNDSALYDLTGFSCDSSPCSEIPIPAALQTLHTARNTYGADLVSLVRVFNDPENDSCGIAWLNGGGRVAITADDEVGGMSVVSDSSGTLYPDNGYFCREETFAHELGHNMGSAHDRDTSDGDDNVLQSDEYGAFTYSFGYKTNVSQGNFYTIMAYGDSGQTSYRVFSNPRITICGGLSCGVTGQADNAQSLTNTMPIVQTFRATVVVNPPTSTPPNLYAIDKQSDSLKTELRKLTGASKYQTISQTTQTVMGNVTPSAWRFRIGDYNGDGKKDIYGISKVGGSGKTEVHIMSGDGYTTYLLHKATLLGKTGADDAWMFDLGDFNADGKLDLYGFKRNSASGKTEVHILNGANQFQSFLLQTTTILPSNGTKNDWRFELGDYNGDKKLDIYAIKMSGTASGKVEVNVLNGSGNFQAYLLNTQTVMGSAGADWDFKLGDYNLDGKPDIYGIKRTGTTGTELHVMSGNGGFKTYLLHITTALARTGSDNTWEFDLD